jgi:hypothetical protein
LKKVHPSCSVVDPGSGDFLPPESGCGINYFRIRDELSTLLRKFDPETIRNKKIGSLMFHPSFYVDSGIRDENMFGSGFQDKTFRIRNTTIMASICFERNLYRFSRNFCK